MINIQGFGHWYRKDGTPSHDSTLRDARKELLYRSVTSIDKEMFKNEGLERYKIMSLAAAAFLNYPQPHESVKDYTKRVWDISCEKAEEAASFGTKVHNAIDAWPTPPPDDVSAYVHQVAAWQDENITEILSSEKTLVCHWLGVAGRMDRRVIHKTYGPCVLDFKTQDVKVDDKGRKKPAFWDSYVRQLAFYAATDARNEGRYPSIDNCLSVVIDSNAPDKPFEHLWPKEEVWTAYEDFVIEVYRWCKNKGYWPAGKWELCDKLKEIPK